MSTQAETTIPGVDIEALKKQHKNIHYVELDGSFVILRSPSLTELDMYQSLAGSGRGVSGMQVLATNLIVAGDRTLIDDEESFKSVLHVMDELFAVKKATIKKL